MIHQQQDLGRVPRPAFGTAGGQFALIGRDALDNALARVFECLRDPVRVNVLPDGTRVVDVLGAFVVTVAPGGAVSVAQWRVEPYVEPELEDIPDRCASVSVVPHGWLWLSVFRSGFAVEVRDAQRALGGPIDAAAINRYAAWVFGVVRGQVRRHCDLRTVRRRVAAALALEPDAVALGWRIGLRSRLGGPLTAREYNVALANLPALRRMRDETPNLMPLYVRFSEAPEFPSEGEPAQRLKRYLRGKGLSERAWKSVAKSSPRLFALADQFFLGEPEERTLGLLALVDAIGFRGETPHWFVRTPLAIFGHADAPRSDHVQCFQQMRAVAAHAARLVEAASPNERVAMRDDLYTVLTWADERRHAPLTALQRRGGWRWLVRTARRHARDKAQRVRALGVRWDVPFERIESQGWQVRALACGAELYDESLEMRHCARNLAAACAEGELLVFSFRHRTSRKRRATVSYRLTGEGWIAEEARGFANGSAPPEWRDVGCDVSERLAAWQGARAGQCEPESDPQLSVAALHELVVRTVRNRDCLEDDVYDWMQRWFEDENPSADCEACGPVLPEEREDDWHRDLRSWIDDAAARGRITERRAQALANGAEPSDRERASFAAAFRRHVLSGDADADDYPSWFVLRIYDERGRHAWVAGFVYGYSFTCVHSAFEGAFTSRREAMRAVRRLGRVGL